MVVLSLGLVGNVTVFVVAKAGCGFGWYETVNWFSRACN